MKIAIMGAGGLGGLFGGMLHGAGEDVALIGRGPHLEAIKEQGLTLKPTGGEPFRVGVRATDDPAEVGPVKLILFCVKTYDIETAGADAQPLADAKTVVLSVQNGVDAPDRLAEIFGRECIIGGVSYHQATVEAPGAVTYGHVAGKLYIGEIRGGGSPRVERIRDTLDRAGLNPEVHLRIRIAMWEKLVLLCATGGVLAFYRKPIGPVLGDPEGRALILDVMREAEAVARAAGIELPRETARRMLALIESDMDPETKSSQLVDLLAGRKLELESLNGEVVRRGLDLGVPTPCNSLVYEALKPYSQGLR